MKNIKTGGTKLGRGRKVFTVFLAIGLVLPYLQMPPTGVVNHKLSVKLSKTFTIDLACEAGQGYSWQLTDSLFAGKLKFEKQTFKLPADSQPGSGGTQTFYFKAVEHGVATIKLVYVQPFAKPYPANPPTVIYKVTINQTSH